MKNLLLTLCLTFFIINLHSQTYISGAITSDETWQITNSPYIVIGNTIVMEDVSLFIEAGVEIEFEENTILQINGTLEAIGTNENRIIFTANSDTSTFGQWGYIKFASSSETAIFDSNNNYISGSILKHCIVEYAGSQYGYGAIYIDEASPFIDNCIIRNNLFSGIEYYSVRDNITQIISNNEIYNNFNGGIKLLSSSGGVTYPDYSIYIIKNTIYNNVSEFGGGINIFTDELSYEEALINISENFIINNNALNKGGGIYLSSFHNIMSAIEINNNLIINNSSPNDNGIFYNFSQDVEFTFNISNNSIINFCNENNFLINGDFYANNGTSLIAAFFHINNNTLWSLNFETHGIYYNLSGNNIPSGYINFNNLFCNDSVYSIYNGNELNIDAENNYFYSTNFDNIIYDWFDDPTLGIVDYNPYLFEPNNSSPISPPIDITKTETNDGILISWQENIENDLAGYKLYYNKINSFTFQNSIDVGNQTSFVLSDITIDDTIAVTTYDNLADGQNDMIEGHESFFNYSDYDCILNDEHNIIFYSFPEQINPATIDSTNHIINIEVANGTDLTNLVATFTLSTGATAFVGATQQESGVTVNDFTVPITYTIEAENGNTQNWIITVNVATAINETDIAQISIFPNPTNRYIFISTEGKIKKITILDNTGKAIIESTNIELDFSEQTNGIYLLIIETESRIYTEKIILVR